MRRVRLPLRWRVAVAFALAALLVTGLLAVVTWTLSSSYMLDQRTKGASQETSVNIRLMDGYLQRHPGASLLDAMDELEFDPDDTVALRRADGWTVSGREIPESELTDLAKRLQDQPDTAPVRLVASGRPVLGVISPVPGHDLTYLELSTVGDLEQASRFVLIVLIVGVAASVLLSLALGRWAANQALRPLWHLASIARRVAAGDLRARLPEQDDADLAPLATTFNRTAEALERRVARDARFAADVSHELRSPLTTMINATAVLDRRRDQLPQPAQTALRLLTADLERFHQLVSDLLEISRDDDPNDEQEPLDFAELVRQVLLARREEVTLETTDPRPLALADRRRLESVVLNLVNNAHRHAGGPVRVAVLQRAGRARLEVDDAGGGIPPELRTEIFERFTRGGRSGARGRHGGSGLGLALVARHVHRHGGDVWVEDRPGGGARFVVELPLAAMA